MKPPSADLQPREGERMDQAAPDAKAKTRAQREAEALRANLLRRKQQARARQAREQDRA